MKNSFYGGRHHFHIPVMGSGFTVDTPLKIARYGISSVVSMVDDLLMEQMRKYHTEQLGLEFEPVDSKGNDPRANRITAYLNFLLEQVEKQSKMLSNSQFEAGSEITKYFELLPESPLKQTYNKMLKTTTNSERSLLEKGLRENIEIGSIDVNIMTKLDRDRYVKGEKLPPESADAMTALRGFAKSKLRSSVVFSAGMNRRLYGYLATFKDFLPDNDGMLKKKIVLKVSDLRSALIQGKYLAKRGLWVSEFRIESGLNCGGHAFATEGSLMGPILNEFLLRKQELTELLHEMYIKGISKLGINPANSPHEMLITAQGGVGTAAENKFLLEHYKLHSIGWGTPFLVVPEVVSLDKTHRNKLVAATSDDVYLSKSSPLGVPFWNLRNSASEEMRLKRIESERPGSPCPKGFLVSDTEFTSVPICKASRTYQKKKLKQLQESVQEPSLIERLKKNVIVKSCICHDLGGGATVEKGINTEATPAVCCGPNIVNFSKIFTLEEMVSHIYGRISIMTNQDRPHMFIRELELYIDHLRDELQDVSDGLLEKTTKRFQEFRNNLADGIDYYRKMAEQHSLEQKEKFLEELDTLFEELESLFPNNPTPVTTC